MNEEELTSPGAPAVDAPANMTEAPPPEKSPGGKRGAFWWLAIVAVLALALAGWQWMETRLRLTETREAMAKRLQESDAAASEARSLARRAQEQFDALQGRLGELEGRISDSKSQQEALAGLYQSAGRNSEEAILTDVEQGVTLASQQLQLAANVARAILALEAADARLANDGQPQFIALRKVIARDLERLRALPQLDLPGMYARLEALIETIDSLPLGVAGRPRAEEAAAAPGERPPLLSADYWRLLALDFWREVRRLVRVQRVDRAEPVLLSPRQDFFLRENLRLRLLAARLALYARDPVGYRGELLRSGVWIERYFDKAEKSVQSALDAIGQLAAIDIRVELPSLNESLSAIRRFRAEKEH